jgi:hypothetical protein
LDKKEVGYKTLVDADIQRGKNENKARDKRQQEMTICKQWEKNKSKEETFFLSSSK